MVEEEKTPVVEEEKRGFVVKTFGAMKSLSGLWPGLQFVGGRTESNGSGSGVDVPRVSVGRCRLTLSNPR